MDFPFGKGRFDDHEEKVTPNFEAQFVNFLWRKFREGVAEIFIEKSFSDMKDVIGKPCHEFGKSASLPQGQGLNDGNNEPNEKINGEIFHILTTEKPVSGNTSG